MTYTTVHSPAWGNADHTTINIIVKFDMHEEEFGFTAAPWDSEPHGRELFERAYNGDFGPIAEYVKPPISIEQIIAYEDDWRIREMEFIADQLIAIEDDDPKALAVTERQWRDYRTLVRGWKIGAEKFPDQTYRPARPR